MNLDGEWKDLTGEVINTDDDVSRGGQIEIVVETNILAINLPWQHKKRLRTYYRKGGRRY